MDEHTHEHSHEHTAEHHEHHTVHGKKIPVWGLVAMVGVVALLLGYFAHGAFSPANPGPNPTPYASAYPTAAAADSAAVKLKVNTYLNELVAAQGAPAGIAVSVTGITMKNGFYSVDYSVTQSGSPAGGGTAIVSLDGQQLILPSAQFDLTKPVPTASPTPVIEVKKSDKPVVELFIMTHCPYGTQAEKGILPAAKALGDKINFSIRFVDYAMHGQKEIDESLNQYCLRSEQNDKFLPYLACFLNASDSAGCQKSTGVDSAKLSACVKAADVKFNVTATFKDQASWPNGSFPPIVFDGALNKLYGVQGSPTLVINGGQVQAGRDPQSMLTAICNGFNTKPSECATALSTTTPGAGFGYDSTSAASAAGCGV